MIELKNDALVFSFPKVHESAGFRLEFQRTLRIPDNSETYSLPPGLGAVPLRHVDDFAGKVPPPWVQHGGVMLPMYQAEAMWLNFDSHYDPKRGVEYPIALKIATGKVNAISGQAWRDGLHRRPQDYVVIPEQPWLDGYCVEKGVIRQFVAMPLGKGYTAEEQITGKAEHGGLQLMAFPMKRSEYERRFSMRRLLNGPELREEVCCCCDMGGCVRKSPAIRSSCRTGTWTRASVASSTSPTRWSGGRSRVSIPRPRPPRPSSTRARGCRGLSGTTSPSCRWTAVRRWPG